jgi:hypothetical protein
MMWFAWPAAFLDEEDQTWRSRVEYFGVVWNLLLVMATNVYLPMVHNKSGSIVYALVDAGTTSPGSCSRRLDPVPASPRVLPSYVSAVCTPHQHQ